MKEMMMLLIKAGITPNEYYVLWSMGQGVEPPIVNRNQESRRLKRLGYVAEADGKKSLTLKSIELIKEVDSFFRKRKKLSDKIIMGDDHIENCKAYNELFPIKKLKSGKNARSAISNVTPGLRWFFDNNDYTWEQVHKATEAYVVDQNVNGDDYMTCSQYFVRKQMPDKSWISLLADWCQAVEDGLDQPPENIFKEKTF